MEEDVAEATPTNSTYGTPVRVASPTPDDVITVENSVFTKCRDSEMERLESQNAEYREKLLRTIRERDLNEELLKNVQGQHRKELESQSKRIRELEFQLKNNCDKSMAQEAHFNVTTREMTQKFNNALQQATKKADQCDKEKNEAVVKYAMREGEMMKLKDEIKNLGGNLKSCELELENIRKSQSQENLDVLEKSIQNLKVEMEKLKHEKFDFENRMKIAEKRVETLTANLTDSQKQGDILRKQLIQAKDDKHLNQQHEKSELERRLREADSDVERLRASQLDMATKFEESSRENSDLLMKIDILQDQLNLEEDRRKLCEEQIEKSKIAEISKNQILESEEEAQECREHAEKMLRLNQELTERNMDLQRKLKDSEVENSTLTSTIENLKSELKLSLESCQQIDEQNRLLLEKLESLENSKIPAEAIPEKLEDLEEKFYRDKYEECAQKLEKVEVELSEEKNNFAAYKKKTNANLKELKSELAGFRKHETPSQGSAHLMAPPTSSDPSMSSRSRNSSITSIDRVTSASREEDVTSAASDEAKRQENGENSKNNLQQIMIDKIVVLQRKLARRTEKCEFLEEHVRQCLEELQKKTKIIQHFALREEASLLMPQDSSMEKVPIVRKSAAYALMGAMFTGSEKKQSQVLTEVNSRLQAVLEDVIQKNIQMRSTVDTLTSDNTRLCRENRLLSLSQVRQD